jgi:plastocyanin
MPSRAGVSSAIPAVFVRAFAGPAAGAPARTNAKARRVKVLLPALALAILASALPAAAATYSGVAAAPGVVWVTSTVPPSRADASIRQTAKAFVPALLVIAPGSTVHFPNDDRFYHSVYSDSPSNPFDLGLYDNGPGKSVVFENAGVVDVRCHVHGPMHATIVVADGPFAVTTHPNERYRIDGLTPGPHALHVWSDGINVATTYVVVK